MRILLAFISLLLLFVSGCSWSPNRDNPVDPASPYYEPPPPRNRSPVIDTLFIVTDCQKDRIADVCAFEARCQVTDADNNIWYDSVFAHLDTLRWRMTYDPGGGYFYVRRSQQDLPTGSLDSYWNRPFTVSVRDDSGAYAERVLNFPEPRRFFPEPDYPRGRASAPDTVWWEHYASVSWHPWSRFGEPHSYEIALYWNESTLAWDSRWYLPRGIGAVDTPFVVPDSLRPNAPVHNFYKWYLTLIDTRGNRMTAEPEYFVAYPYGPSPMVISEPMAVERP